MAERRPLVVVAGGITELPVGDTLPGAGGAVPGWQVSATGTGASQNITLPEAIAAAAVFVFVNGLRQEPTTDYTVSGTTLTITAPSGSTVRVEKPAGNPGKDGEPGTDGTDAIGIPDAPSDGKTYGRKDGAWAEASSGGSGSVALPRPPWIKRIASDWRNVTNASAAVTAATLRLIPFTCQGLEITAVDFHVQGSITAGTVLFLAIYAADDVTGLPTGTKLWDNGSGTSITAAGAMSVPVTGLTNPPKAIWVATYINAGTTQFVTGGVTGDAEREYGIPVGGALNASIIAFLATNTWAGAMPDTITYGSNPFTTGGNVVNTLIRMAAPA